MRYQPLSRSWICHGPTNTLLGRVGGAVLGVLFRSEQPLTVREVQRLADTGSYEGIRLALKRMAESGLLEVDERTSGTFYRINRDHLAYPAVEALFAMRYRLKRLVGETIEGWPKPPVHASFFGSYVRQDGGLDIDILVDFDDETYEDKDRWAEQVGSLERSVQRWTGNAATVLTMSASDLRAMASGRRATALWKSLRSDALLVLWDGIDQGDPMTQPRGRTGSCGAGEACDRYLHAQSFLDTAEVVLEDTTREGYANVSGALAVLAGIAIACRLL